MFSRWPQLVGYLRVPEHEYQHACEQQKHVCHLNISKVWVYYRQCLIFEDAWLKLASWISFSLARPTWKRELLRTIANMFPPLGGSLTIRGCWSALPTVHLCQQTQRREPQKKLAGGSNSTKQNAEAYMSLNYQLHVAWASWKSRCGDSKVSFERISSVVWGYLLLEVVGKRDQRRNKPDLCIPCATTQMRRRMLKAPWWRSRLPRSRRTSWCLPAILAIQR